MPETGSVSDVIDLTVDHSEGFQVAELLSPEATEYQCLTVLKKLELSINSQNCEFGHVNQSIYANILNTAEQTELSIGKSLCVLAACAAAWINHPQKSVASFRQTLSRLVVKYTQKINPYQQHPMMSSMVNFIVGAICTPPEIVEPFGTKTILESVFDTIRTSLILPSSESGRCAEFPIMCILSFLSYTREDIGLATISPLPWKCLAMIASKNLSSSLPKEAVPQLFAYALPTLLESIAKDGIIAADFHLHSTKPLFSCALLLTARMHDLQFLSGEHVSMLLLLALLLLKAHKLSSSPNSFFLKQFSKLAKFLMLHRPQSLVEEIKSYLNRANQHNQNWLKQLGENPQISASLFVALIWTQHDLWPSAPQPHWIDLLFKSLPFLLSEIQTSTRLYKKLLTSCLLSLLSSPPSLITLLEPILFKHLLSPHPLLFSFSLDFWHLINLSADDELQIRYASALSDILISVQPALYPDRYPDAAPNLLEYSIRSKLSNLSKRMCNSWRAPALSHFYQLTILSTLHIHLRLQHLIDIVPINQTTWHNQYLHLFSQSVTFITNNTPYPHTRRSVLALRVVSKLLTCFYSHLPYLSVLSLQEFLLRQIHTLPFDHPSLPPILRSLSSFPAIPDSVTPLLRQLVYSTTSSPLVKMAIYNLLPPQQLLSLLNERLWVIPASFIHLLLPVSNLPSIPPHLPHELAPSQQKQLIYLTPYHSSLQRAQQSILQLKNILTLLSQHTSHKLQLYTLHSALQTLHSLYSTLPQFNPDKFDPTC